MKSNEGYINIISVMQKYFDQAISGNWSYNPTHFDNNEVPMSVMIGDLLNTYKYGWKTSYYQNTYDYKTDGEIAFDDAKQQPVARDEFTGSDEEYEEHCESCAI